MNHRRITNQHEQQKTSKTPKKNNKKNQKMLEPTIHPTKSPNLKIFPLPNNKRFPDSLLPKIPFSRFAVAISG